MPSLEGDEIEVALDAGFREQNLHVVDQNPAIVATLKRRFGRINTYGIPLRAALRRLYRNGARIHCMNVDLCNTFSQELASTLIEITLFGFLGNISDDCSTFDGCGGIFADAAMVAVTLLRGREARAVHEALTENGAEIDKLSNARDFERTNPAAAAIVRLSGAADSDDSVLKVLRSVDSAADRGRLFTVYRILAAIELPPHVRPWVFGVRSEIYRSNNGQTMLWSIWKLRSAAARLRVISERLLEANGAAR